jgi:hypothetical protein
MNCTVCTTLKLSVAGRSAPGAMGAAQALPPIIVAPANTEAIAASLTRRFLMIFSNVDLPTPLSQTPEQPFCSLKGRRCADNAGPLENVSICTVPASATRCAASPARVTNVAVATDLAGSKLQGISGHEFCIDSALHAERPRSYGRYWPYVFLEARMQRGWGAGQGLCESGAGGAIFILLQPKVNSHFETDLFDGRPRAELKTAVVTVALTGSRSRH